MSDDPSAFVEPVREWTGGDGVDVVLDLVGGDYVRAGVDALAHAGRMVLVGRSRRGRAEIELGKALHKRLTITGTVLRARPLEEKIAATRRFAAEVVPLLASGAVSPVVDRVFPLEDARGPRTSGSPRTRRSARSSCARDDPARHDRLFAAAFAAYTSALVRRRLAAVWTRGALSRTRSPLLVAAQHVGRWDPMVLFHLARPLLGDALHDDGGGQHARLRLLPPARRLRRRPLEPLGNARVDALRARAARRAERARVDLPAGAARAAGRATDAATRAPSGSPRAHACPSSRSRSATTSSRRSSPKRSCRSRSRVCSGGGGRGRPHAPRRRRPTVCVRPSPGARGSISSRAGAARGARPGARALSCR